MNSHGIPSIPSMEPLEARLMLSCEASLPLTLAPHDGALEALDGVTTSLFQGADEAGPLIDAGDYYLYEGKPIHLLRSQSQVVVSFAEGANVDGLIAQWTQPGGLLAGFEKGSTLSDNVVVLKDPGAGAGLDAVLGRLATQGTVEWTGPTFVYEETGTRLWATNEVIVALQAGVDPATFFAEFGSYTQLFMNQYILSVQGGSMGSLQTAIALANNPDVDWASPNFYQDFRVSTNDTLYSSQWDLNNTGQTGALSDADADVAEAWSTTTGSSDIVIAVLDNGVQTDHPDLNIFTNPGEIAGNGIDDDGNGFIDDVNGWDFTGSGDNNPNPTTAFDNHGTAVAGVAAAHGSNSLGVTGVSQHSTILPIKIATDTTGGGGGFVSNATIAQAVYYAAGFTQPEPWGGADIINCSWGGGAPDNDLTNAFNYVAEHGRDGLGCAVFVAAGNYGSGYLPYTLDTSGLPAGTYAVEWEYRKDPGGAPQDEGVWLANVTLPDANGTRVRFDSSSLPTGWNGSPYSEPAWTVVDDPSHAYGVGRYEVRAGTISDNGSTTLRSNTFTISPGAPLEFCTWISTEKGTTAPSYPPDSDDGDWLFLWLNNVSTNHWYGYYVDAGTPGDRRSARSDDFAVVSGVSYPANLDKVIAVGASTDWDYRAAYGQYGSALDFVAPSSGGYAGITTTDRTGTDGYNTAASTAGNYTNTVVSAFGGTSAAAPLAAGIGALLLSENPGLTATQIRDIMRASADHIGSVTYTSGFNSYYGYGRVNAEATLDSIGPNITADITDVSPDPRDSSVSSITITFSQSVNNFDLADLTLEREDQAVTFGGGVSLTADNDFDTFTLSGLSGLTGDPGKYELILTAEGSLITGADTGDYLSGDATDVWYMNTVSGVSGNDTIVVSKDGSHIKIDINSGTTVYYLDFSGFPALNINGLGGDDTLTVDLSDGNPIPAAGITFDGGTGTDTVEIVGSTGADTVTLTGGTPAASSFEISVANVEAFIAALGADDDTLNLKIGTFEFAEYDFSLGAGEDVLSITDASVTINNNVGDSGSDDNDTVETNGESELTFNATQHLKLLELCDASFVTLEGDGTNAIVTKTLKINENQTLDATLDLTDNNLVVDYAGGTSPLAQINAWVKHGANFNPTLGEMFWDGTGITSSTAAADPGHYSHQLLALGVRQAVDAGAYGMNQMTSVDGVALNNTSVVVKFTWMGDADLDGSVTINDYYVLDYYYTYGTTVPGWWTGDFNGNGHITIDDYYLIDVGYTYQGDPL